MSRPPTPPGPWEADSLPALSPAHLAWLASLPATLSLADAFLCHATPQDDTTYWLHQVRPDGNFAPSPLSRIAPRAEGIEQALILCGHTHIAQAARLPDGRLIVNPGSVGCPGYEDDHPVRHRAEAGSPHAAYAILDRRGEDWQIDFRRIPYDTGPAVALAARRGRPDWAAVLATGFLSQA